MDIFIIYILEIIGFICWPLAAVTIISSAVAASIFAVKLLIKMIRSKF